MRILRRSAAVVAIAACAGIAACSSTGTVAPAAAIKQASAAALPATQAATLSASGQVTVVHPQVQAGLVTLTFTSKMTPSPSASFDMQLFALHSGVTLTEFRQELPGAFGSNSKAAAAAVTWIIPRTVALGGNPGTNTTQIQAVLPAGTYYVGDLSAWVKAGGKSGLASFHVSGSASGATLPATSQSISMVELSNMPRFTVQPTTLKQGWTLIRNDSGELHQAFMAPVKQGATVQEVITSLNGNGSIFTGLPVGVDALSPHGSVNWLLQSPPGHYALVCFVADPMTGKPHYQMGMVALITVAAGTASG